MCFYNLNNKKCFIGISNNNRICDIKLNLDGSLESRGCATVVEQNIASCPIAILSLRDNALEHDLPKILPVLAKMHHLKSLDLGGSNFNSLRNNKKYNSVLSKTLGELADLITNSESVSIFKFFLLNIKLNY